MLLFILRIPPHFLFVYFNTSISAVMWKFIQFIFVLTHSVLSSYSSTGEVLLWVFHFISHIFHLHHFCLRFFFISTLIASWVLRAVHSISLISVDILKIFPLKSLLVKLHKCLILVGSSEILFHSLSVVVLLSHCDHSNPVVFFFLMVVVWLKNWKKCVAIEQRWAASLFSVGLFSTAVGVKMVLLKHKVGEPKWGGWNIPQLAPVLIFPMGTLTYVWKWLFWVTSFLFHCLGFLGLCYFVLLIYNQVLQFSTLSWTTGNYFLSTLIKRAAQLFNICSTKKIIYFKKMILLIKLQKILVIVPDPDIT